MEDKKSQLNVLSVLALILTSMFVGAAVVNESLNETVNNTIAEITGELINDNLTETINEPSSSETINETEPNMSILVENTTEGISEDVMSIDNSTNETLAETLGATNETVILDETQIEMNVTKNQSEINATIETIVINASLNQTIENNSNVVVNESQANISLNKTEPKLAEFVNGQSIHTEYYDNDYSKHFDLSKTKFDLVETGSAISTSLKIGNKIDWIKGYTIDNENYAIHLVWCNKQKKTCNFRVNGILVRGLSVGDTFDLNADYSFKVKSITLDFCDNKPVCDYLFDTYDLVEIEVLPK